MFRTSRQSTCTGCSNWRFLGCPVLPTRRVSIMHRAFASRVSDQVAANFMLSAGAILAEHAALTSPPEPVQHAHRQLGVGWVTGPSQAAAAGALWCRPASVGAPDFLPSMTATCWPRREFAGVLHTHAATCCPSALFRCISGCKVLQLHQAVPPSSGTQSVGAFRPSRLRLIGKTSGSTGRAAVLLIWVLQLPPLPQSCCCCSP